jgi:hypothetical protein
MNNIFLRSFFTSTFIGSGKYWQFLTEELWRGNWYQTNSSPKGIYRFICMKYYVKGITKCYLLGLVARDRQSIYRGRIEASSNFRHTFGTEDEECRFAGNSTFMSVRLKTFKCKQSYPAIDKI